MRRIRDYHPKHLLRQSLAIIAIGIVVGVFVNLISPKSIAWVGVWKVAYDSTGMVKPDYFEEQDTLIMIDEAIAMYQSNNTVFIDARFPEDYEMGHIKGALLLPFEEYDDYIDEIRSEVPKDAPIVTYCSEEDCDASLYLARILREDEGYKEIYTLYGGYEKWLEAQMPIEKGYPQR